MLVAGATVLYAAAMLALAYLTNLPSLGVAMVLSGVAWIAVLSSLQVSAQLALPNWVRSRGLAVFMASFMGSMAFGSLMWGYAAQQTSIATALVLAAAGAVLAIGVTWRWKLSAIEEMDLTPSMHWPSPPAHEDMTPDRGPVMVTIGYRVEPAHRGAFLSAVRDLGKRRKRDGAFAWGVLEDTETPSHLVEYFMVESWLEHLRQHERVTNADRVLQDDMRSMLVKGSEPEVMHYVAPDGEAEK
jgi:MFS family permease